MGKKRRLCKVVEVDPCDSMLKPVMMEFEHGLLKENQVDKLQCDVMVNADNSKDYMVILNSDEDQYQYRGRKISKDSQLSQKVLIIRNKRTNELRIVPVEQITVSRYLENVEEEEADVDVVSDKVDYTEATDTFGSKSAQKKARQNLAKRTTNEDFKLRLEETVIESQIHPNDLSVNENTRISFLPVVNPNATSVSNIYELETLFGSADILDGITETAQVALECSPSKPDNEYSEFFVKSFKALRLEGRANENTVKCLLFADALYKFLQIEAKKLNQKAILFSICPTSKYIRNLVLDGFTVRGRNGRSRPLTMKDKAVSYVLVLLMIAFDYKLGHTFVLNACTKLGAMRKLSTIATAVGFTNNAKLKYWSLNFPLPAAKSPGLLGSKGKKKIY